MYEMNVFTVQWCVLYVSLIFFAVRVQAWTWSEHLPDLDITRSIRLSVPTR